jgi:hypothetical protein
MDQAEEEYQMELEYDISKCLDSLYQLLGYSDRVEAEEWRGFVAEWKSILDGERSEG